MAQLELFPACTARVLLQTDAMSPHPTDVAAHGAAKPAARNPRLRTRPTDPLFRREMRERWRRPLTLLQLLLFASALSYLGYNIYYTTVPLSDFSDLEALTGVGRNFFFALAQWHAAAWVPAGLLLAAPTLAAERERGNLTDWVLAGLTPTDIVRAKWRSLASFVLVMVCVPFPIFALCFPLGGVSPFDFAAAFALTVSIALNSVALGILVSSNAATITKALWSALLLGASVIILGAPILVASIGESSLASLMLAGATLWLPAVWIKASAKSFEIAVERHIKDEGPRSDSLAATALPIAADNAQVANNAQVARIANNAQIMTGATTAATPSFSQVETLILRATQNNAIAHRDVKRRFVSQRAYALSNDANEFNVALWVWILLWLSAGASGLLVVKSTNSNGLLQGLTFLVLMAAMSVVALGAAPGFTRERAQKMLSALQMTALSPLDIVWGKILSVLLLCAQYFAGALLALCVLALSIGPLSALALASFGVSCVTFTAMGSLTLSLWSRKTEIVALGALASIAALWWVIPMLYTNSDLSPFFRAPLWLERLWLGPLRVILQPASDAQLALALAQLAAICLVATLLMGTLCVLQLRRTRAEEEETGWLQRDLSRGWK